MKPVKRKQKPCLAVLLNACAMSAILVTLATTFCEESYAGKVQEYFEYLSANKCSKGKDDCLEKVDHVVIRSDGRRVRVSDIYRWRKAAYLKYAKVLPHFMLGYMRKLREAYRDDPTFGRRFYNQIDYLISKAVDRNGALVWENHNSYVQGMDQIEYAEFFATAAEVYREHGDRKTARGLMTKALLFARALDMQHGRKTGGIRSKVAFCGAKKVRFRPCYWFHSRGLGVVGNDRLAVLNQHLHVVRDVLKLYMKVKNHGKLVSEQFGTHEQVLQRLEAHAIAGMYQLAFSGGAIHSQPHRAPNIRQFMWFHDNATVKSGKNPIDYYWAYYGYDMPTDVPEKGSPAGSQCHYHTHTVKIMADIAILLRENEHVFRASRDGWRLYEALDELLARTDRSDRTGAIYRFVLSERSEAIKIRRKRCPCKPWHQGKKINSCGEELTEIRVFYEQEY